MKNILLLVGLLIGFYANAQILGYTDFGVLLSNENQQGSARTMGMKNAFGALGGDLSAIAINPASGAVFNSSMASFTLGYEGKNIESDFYGNTISSAQNEFSVTQAGGLLIFDNDIGESSLNKLSMSVNYNMLNDFSNSWQASSSNFVGTFLDEDEASNYYPNVDSQYFTNTTSGKQSEINFSIGTQFDEKFNFGLSFNAYNLTFNEESTRKEVANDGAGNFVDIDEFYWQDVIGNGFSFGLGTIIKVTQNLRLGLAYRSPVWYEIHEESNMYNEQGVENDPLGYYSILYSDDPPAYTNNRNKILAYDYNLRTPNKLTGSAAYVFNTKGLVSADITYNNFKEIKLRNDFSDVNQKIDATLTNSLSLNLGAEWRFSNLSARGGISYQQSPYIDAFDTDDKRGFSLGLGYNFGGTQLDIAYDYTEKTDYYNFYPDFSYVEGSELKLNNSKFLATLTFKL